MWASKPTDTIRAESCDVQSPRFIIDGSRSRPRGHPDEMLFNRWRLRLIAFYGAAALLLIGGFAVLGDRSSTITRAQAPANSTVASSDATGHRN
jgi:hypothetical protein